MAKLILITGGSASGKTTLAHQLKDKLGDRAILISQDMFYKPTQSDATNYDAPEAFDFDTQLEVLAKLRYHEEAEVPIYDFTKHDRVGSTTQKPAEIIIFEGLFAFYDERLMNIAALKIFVDTPADIRLGRRVLRDVKERERDVEEVVSRWNRDVQPSYKKHIAGFKKYSDMIVPWTIVNTRATNFIVGTIGSLENDK